jgi:tRNA (guanine37-N1)-methyltransferase
MRIDILTLFPRMFEGVLSESMLRIAQEANAVSFHLHELRAYGLGRHRHVDDRPYGGGPGMVLRPEPLVNAVRAVREQEPGRPGRLLWMCPRGRRFEQAVARELSGEDRLILVAGHYEGYDERAAEILGGEALSVGDVVLTGGELPALCVIDAVVRLLPGVLGHAESAECESFAPGNAGLLEYPQYTRPAEFEGRAVPEVLLSGDHAKIAAWRRAQALERTRRDRPDLLDAAGGGPVGGVGCEVGG